MKGGADGIVSGDSDDVECVEYDHGDATSPCVEISDLELMAMILCINFLVSEYAGFDNQNTFADILEHYLVPIL